MTPGDSMDPSFILHPTKVHRLLKLMQRGGGLHIVSDLAAHQLDEQVSNQVTVGAMSISEETFEQLNASVHSVKLPEESGGGYMGLLVMVHQLHCVVCGFCNLS